MSKGKSGGRGRSSRVRGAGRIPRLNQSRAPKRAHSSRRSASSWRESSSSVFTRGSEPSGDDLRGRRLNQVLAAAGLGSRRQVEELILDGRVEIDGETITDLSVRVVPGEHKIKVDGEGLAKTRPTYVAFNKPKNTLCTNSDPSGRRRVVDFMPREYGRLFTVGRLDQNSEGLILLTNDGALAERLTHPRFEVPKKYRVQVAGLVDTELANALKRGVHIAEGVVQADEVVVRSRHKKSSVLEITLTEGKNREIRRMLARVGHKVMQLQRVQVGSIKLGKLAPGESRRLTSQEVAELYQMAEPRPYADAADAEAASSLRPVEVTQLAERESEKAAQREGVKPEGKGGQRDAKSRVARDPNFTSATRKQFQRSRTYENEPEFDRSPGSFRRAPKSEFREEFRSEERRSERRRARREYDDEARTIGPKVFSREETRSGARDSFNEDESSRDRRSHGAGGSRVNSSSRSFNRGSKKTARQPRPGKRGGSGRRGR